MSNHIPAIILSLSLVISCADSQDHSADMSKYTTPDLLEGIIIQSAIDENSSYETIGRKEAEEDLHQLENLITSTHSYIYRTDFDYRAAIAYIKKHLPDNIAVPVLALQIHKLIQNIGDSHAWVNQWLDCLPKRYAPVKYGIKDNRIFAYQPGVSALLSDEYPYVQSIDGVDIKHWYQRAGNIGSGANSSQSSRFFRSQKVMPFISFMRSELGIEDYDSVTYVLENQAKSAYKTVKLPILLRPIEPDNKPFNLSNESKLLSDDIGYLRIYSQNSDELLSRIDSLMLSFRHTNALIIDARQCGGGKRSNLQALFPYFMNPNDSPYIANVAKLRIPYDTPDFDPKGKLRVGDKKLKYIKDDDVTENELIALEKFLTSFHPQFETPNDKFTDWYFMAMTAKPDKYFYDNPVYLLMDFGVGSAGDIFVSTFKSWRNITLVGTPSNGRSGNSVVTPLKNSQISVRLSTMISYQKTGELFDWTGIKPDIFIEPKISDWTGKTDTMLDSVLVLINE